jgi:hypothetical protein
MNNNLDDLLKRRSVPNPSHNLSERIIAASQAHKAEPLWQKFFMFPKPALAFACFVLLGLAIAWPQLQQTSIQSDDYAAQEYFASVMDDDFIYEAFDISSI